MKKKFTIVAPLMTLLKDKFHSINWIEECGLSFVTLKETLTQILVLTIMNPWKGNIVLCTDASDLAIGAILMQDKVVIAYESCKLIFMELNYPVHEKKLLVAIHALKICRHYMLGIKFKIEIDHKSLKYLSIQNNLSRK